MRLSNIQVHTYHSFVYHLYDPNSKEFDDAHITFEINPNNYVNFKKSVEIFNSNAV